MNQDTTPRPALTLLAGLLDLARVLLVQDTSGEEMRLSIGSRQHHHSRQEAGRQAGGGAVCFSPGRGQADQRPA